MEHPGPVLLNNWPVSCLAFADDILILASQLLLTLDIVGPLVEGGR